MVSPSVWLANEAKRSALFSDARVETISNCVDPAVFNADGRVTARQKLGVTDKTVCIGFAPLNRAERRKGFAELAAALAILATRTKGVDVRLLVLGEDAEKDTFAFPAIGVAAVEREADVAAVLSACDICVTPSLEDNLPNTILEAMACGVPVVAFDVGGAKDVIVDGENGALVAAGDTAALAETLAALVTDTAKRQAMGQAARKHAKDSFTPKRQAAAYNTLYKSLTKTTPQAAARPGHAKRVSETAPAGVLAAAWPTFMTYTAQAHQAALDQIERNRNWAEKTEDNLGAARERASEFKDWAKRSDATLAETKALLEKTRQWALESEEALAKQRAHGDEMEKWARKSDAVLDERNTLLAQVQAWARNSDAALVQRTAELQEVQAWAHNSDAALAQRTAELQEALAWARKSDALLTERNALIEELKVWAEGAEARVSEGKTELEALRTHSGELQIRQSELEAASAALELARAELERRVSELTAALAASEAELDRVSWSRRWQRLMKALNAPR
ncbi:MAG: glycosyltransferase [Hyphomonadaceae bacterium]|nr:glycosyltransferase [Hyphomonadaceae bacterium]